MGHALVTQVGRRIAEVRGGRGLTQQQVASALGVSTKYYQRIERGDENLTLESLARIAEVLEVAVQALFDVPRRAAPRRGRPRAQDRQASVLGPSAAFRVVEPTAAGAVPLLSVAAAAGFHGQSEPAEAAAWVVPITRRRLEHSMFVARVVGTSMEPKIPDGAYCLFDARSGLVPDGSVHLVELRDTIDPDTGSRFTVKRVDAVRQRGRRGRGRLRLRGMHPEAEEMELEAGSEDDPPVRLIAKLIEVLGC